MAHVYARDIRAKDDEPKRYHVEECASWQAAKEVADYIAQRVDAGRWAMSPEYAARSGEPDWDSKAHMRESPNEPQPDAIDPTVKPLW